MTNGITDSNTVTDVIFNFLREHATIAGILAIAALLGLVWAGISRIVDIRIEKKLSSTTVEERVADKISDKVIRAAEIINETNRQLDEVESQLTALRGKKEAASLLASQVAKDLQIAASSRDNLRAELRNAESQLLSLTEQLSNADNDTIAKANSLIDVINQADAPASILLDLQSSLDRIKEHVLFPENLEWKYDYRVSALRDYGQGGMFAEQKPQVFVDSAGMAHLRGNVMLELGMSLEDSKDPRFLTRQIDKSYVAEDGGDIQNVVLYLPREYAPEYSSTQLALELGGKPRSITIDPRTFATDGEGNTYFAIECYGEWHWLILDGISWRPKDPVAAIQRNRRDTTTLRDVF